MARTNPEPEVDEIDLTPDSGGAVDFSGGLDVEELKLNFSAEEAGSVVRDFSPIPAGKYHVKVTDGEVKRSTSSKNYGKPYYALTLTIQDGPHVDRKLWANVMLFSGALFTIAQIMKAMGRNPNKDKVPTLDELQGQDFTATVAKVVDKYKIEQGEWDASSGEPKPMKNEVKGFSAYLVDTVSGEASLMP